MRWRGLSRGLESRGGDSGHYRGRPSLLLRYRGTSEAGRHRPDRRNLTHIPAEPPDRVVRPSARTRGQPGFESAPREGVHWDEGRVKMRDPHVSSEELGDGETGQLGQRRPKGGRLSRESERSPGRLPCPQLPVTPALRTLAPRADRDPAPPPRRTHGRRTLRHSGRDAAAPSRPLRCDLQEGTASSLSRQSTSPQKISKATLIVRARGLGRWPYPGAPTPFLRQTHHHIATLASAPFALRLLIPRRTGSNTRGSRRFVGTRA